MNAATFYITASSTRNGALAVYHVYADEAILAACLDGRTGGRGIREECNSLGVNELRYGWLHDESRGEVDEVMLARPLSGMRVLMTHGGGAIREAVTGYLERVGFENLKDAIGNYPILDINTFIYDAILSSCITEAQAAAVLEARMKGDAPPGDILLTRRFVLAGPPNAGKSSLLNCLSGYERAFVHTEAGATRDVVDELVDLGGYAVWVGDLPGFSAVEEGGEAWGLASRRLALADWILFVVDGSGGWGDEAGTAAREVAGVIGGSQRVLVVLNKSDLSAWTGGEPWREHFPDAGSIAVSSLPGGDARRRIAEWLGEETGLRS